MSSRIKKLQLLGLFAAGTVLGALSVSGQQSEQTKFLTDAIRGDIAEVQLGELAQKQGQSQEVRHYGDMLSKDHTKALKKASELAKQLGVPAPSEPSAQQQRQYEALAKLSGTEFDTTFMSQMVRGHQEAIAKYSAEAQAGSSSEVTALAKETLPTLKMHLEHAQSIQKAASSSTHYGRGSGDHPSGSSSSDVPRPPGSSESGGAQGSGSSER